MKRRVGIAGFTIVEVMIVLVVTSLLFTLIALTIAGRQRSNEFTQAINDVRSALQQQISEVQAGYYPRSGSFSCNSGPSISTGGSVGQGSNGPCVYLGKAFQFGLSSAPETVRVYTVVGNRSGTDIASANPTPVTPVSVSDYTFQLKYGLTVGWIRYAGTNTGTFAVMNAPLDTSVSQANGNTQLDVYGMPAPSLGQADGLLTATHLDSIVANPAGGVQICLNSGGTNQNGLITIGQNNRQLAVDLKIRDGVC